MKTRFAPSPTGYLHLGNARTALFNYFFAQVKKGNFLLRIEDSDDLRSTPEQIQALQNDLIWLGVKWQEGPNQDGHLGPYFQSQRQNIYENYYQKLSSRGLAYPCFCTEQELAIERKAQLDNHQPPRYNGKCRSLTSEHAGRKMLNGEKPALRFRIPDQTIIRFIDLVKGEQVFFSQDIGDFIIQRADGKATFFFCNAIDDALMGITHVIRGEDHVSNTPRQILLFQALNFLIPTYGHINLIVSFEDNSPLSKSKGSESLKDLRMAGYFPEALQNYLGRLGHSYTDPTFMSLGKLIANFNLENLSKSQAHHDPIQLLYWQKQALKHLDDEKIWLWLGSDTHALVPHEQKAAFINLVRTNTVFPSDALSWATILFSDPLTLQSDLETQLNAVDPTIWRTAIQIFQQSDTSVQNLIKELEKNLQTTGIKGKALFQPLRLALTSRTDGPELAKLIALLGPGRVIQRLQTHLH